MEKPLYIMDKLTEIMAWKRRACFANTLGKLTVLLAWLEDGNENSFRNALSNDDELSVIAEIKRESPSAGASPKTPPPWIKQETT